MEERWLPCPEFSGYEVSDLGRVRSIPRRGTSGRLVTPDVVHNGYLRVALWREGRRTWARLHRLVLLAFVGPCPELHEGAHTPNPDRLDCRLTNLKWELISVNRTEANQRRSGSGLSWMDVIEAASAPIEDLSTPF